uniref:Non-virion protein n=1 Tax=Novirhabdovirus hirame TaxID=1980915 RepID=C9WE69_9RHAB|nr:non-virion protein [Novirhabdovirus hirame]
MSVDLPQPTMNTKTPSTDIAALKDLLRYKVTVARHGFLFDDGKIVWSEDGDEAWNRLLVVVGALRSSNRMSQALFMDMSITKGDGYLLFSDLQGTNNLQYRTPNVRQYLFPVDEFLPLPR